MLEKKTVKAEARACTSIIEILRSQIDLGDCQVGIPKVASIMELVDNRIRWPP